MEKIKSKPTIIEPNEDGFSITGVNHYKHQLEQNIQVLKKKVKDMQRKVHWDEIIEKRLSKEHSENVHFTLNEEKDKG